MKTHFHIRHAVSAVVLALAGCATSQPAPEQRPVAQNTRPVARPKADAAEQAGPDAHTQRAFDDAVKSFQATQAAEKPDWTEPERKFKQVAAMDEDFAEVYLNLGVIYEKERKPDDAKEMYEKALAKKPSLRQAAENLAVMEENAGHQDKAIQAYQEMVQKYPQDGGSRARIAALYEAQGQGEQALKLAREALMRDPKNLTAYKVMMRVYLDEKNYSLAELVALRATKLDASDPELYFTMGEIALAQKDEVRAIEQFRHAVKERDDYLPARQSLAAIAVRHHDYAGASVQYEKLAQYQPKSAAAHLDLGIAYKGTGQVDKAFQQYAEVKKLDENNAEVYYAEGLIFEKNKSLPDKALEDYKTFIQKAGSIPGDHPVYESIKNCEQLIAIQQQSAQQEKDQKAKEEMDKKIKEQEEKNKAATDKDKPPAAGAPAAGAPPAGGKPVATPASAPAAGGPVKPAAAKPEEKPAAAPAEAAPAKPSEKQPPSPVDNDEPPDSAK